MFEKAKPPAIPNADRISMRDLQEIDPSADGAIPEGEHVEALPLRAIEWSELIARLNAARDLRQVLREDVGAQKSAEGLGFADAAAQFFRTGEDDERDVNLTALERLKASSGMYQNVKSKGRQKGPFANHESADAASYRRAGPGDAREEQ